ncbi:hypothetical protein GCM10011390_34090 [Aureimonas endophytica]|uniref:Cupin type-2 domain-containing protein n=1 Tax=Aureimonas endophytica TaxID=2027858 RepID=A0A916ZTA6_9HYPH|nr:cupin domain-containing protein [Aureimonas endophytica]GGE12107.1 hypothetical protein GCM10011390_34090 [Aureimonas endophytica]
MEADDRDLVRIGDLELRFRIGEPSATVFEFRVPPRARVPAPHHHAEADEIVYGLDGILTVTLDGVVRELAPGEAVFIPRGRVHHHENRHPGPARALVVITPGTITRAYFEELAAVIDGPGRPDPEKVHAVMARHGLVPA